MIAILFVLLGIYYIVYKESRPTPEQPRPLRRMLMVALIVTMTMYGYSHYSANRPPVIDYYRVGWFFQIQDINAQLSRLGSPYRMPIPEGWK